MSYDQSRVSAFISEVKEVLSEGYRFVPFVGAGFSLASGHPIVSQLEDGYLPYCILRALGLGLFAPEQKWRVYRFVPRSGDWPDSAAELSRFWRTAESEPYKRLVNRGLAINRIEESLNETSAAGEPIDEETRFLLLRARDAVAGDWLEQFRVSLSHTRHAERNCGSARG